MEWSEDVPEENGFYWYRANKEYPFITLVEIFDTKTYGKTALVFTLRTHERETCDAFGLPGDFAKITMPKYASHNQFGAEDE